MNNRFALIRFLCMLVVSTWVLASARAQELSFTLVDKFIIGNDEEAPADYLFSSPELVRTDSRGYIYVRDRRRADVRVFDENGRYVTTVGKRGEGPGEMREIFGMHVDDQDRLIVADRISARFTIFKDLGRSFETKKFAEKMTISPDPILSLEDSFVLKYVRLHNDPEGELPYIKDDKTLHLYDTDLNWIESFVKLDDIFDLDQPFLQVQSDSPDAMRMAANGSDTIILVPTVYSGHLFRCTHSNSSWSMAKLKGGPTPRRAYISVSDSEFEANPELQKSSISTRDPSGLYRARIFNWSLGVVVLSTGEFVNFTMQTPLRGDFGLRAELFDQTGMLSGYGPLRFDNRALNRRAEIMSEIDILWHDTDDRIYLRRPNKRGFYVLSIAELVIRPL